MAWPWNKKKQLEDRLLKDQLRQRARTGSSEPAAPTVPDPPVEPLIEPSRMSADTPLIEPGLASLQVEPTVAPAPTPPRSVPGPVSQGGKAFFGKELTVHYSKRRVRTELNTGGNGHRANPVRRALRGIGSAFGWVFRIKPKFLIIERYIWGECFGLFLLGAMGFTFFMLVTSIFSLGEKIFSKNIPPFTIAKVLILSAPAFLVLAIPVAVIFATMMGMNRMNRDNELVAFATNGISLYRIFVPFISLGIFAGVMTWLIYENVVPANNISYKETLKVFWEAAVVDFIKPEIVIKAPQKKYFYVDSINKSEGIMYGLRLYDYFSGEGKPARNFPRVFIAKKAWVEDKFLVLNDVRLYDLDKDRGDSLICATMPEISIDIGARTKSYFLEPHPTELKAEDLRNRISRLRDRMDALKFPAPNMRTRLLRDWTEYYFKFSIPFACLAFVMVAVPISLRGPRDERNLGIIMTFVLVMCYYVIFFIARTIGSRGVVMTNEVAIAGHKIINVGANLFPPQIAGWLAPAIFLIAAAFLIVRARR